MEEDILDMEEETLDIIQKIREARSPKYFLWNIIKETKWFASENHTDYLIAKKDDTIYFSYDEKTHTLYYGYNNIFRILETKYHLNESNSNKLVGEMVSEHFKLKVDTTHCPQLH